MGITSKPFFALTRDALPDLLQAKSAMSARYLTSKTVSGERIRPFTATIVPATASNVVGVGIDEKIVGNVPTGITSIKFLVRTKTETGILSRREKLPSSIDGIPTDVEEVGLIIPMSKRTGGRGIVIPNPRLRIRPAQPGSSISFRAPGDQFITAGTFGLLVKDVNGNLYILSNNHVLAFESGIEADGITRRAMLQPGAPIFQPGLLDNGKIATDQIAELTRWIDLRADRADNVVDCAIARVIKGNTVSQDILFIGKPTGTRTASKDMIVHKFGRTTAYRAGRVSSTFFDVKIPYGVGEVVFTDQIAIRGLNGSHFSDAGDSGSAILDRSSNDVVGLLFAGSTNGQLTFGNHIADVLGLLNVQLA